MVGSNVNVRFHLIIIVVTNIVVINTFSINSANEKVWQRNYMVAILKIKIIIENDFFWK